MNTVGCIELRRHVGRMGLFGHVVDVDMGQWIIEDEGQRLGYVAELAEPPPINLIVRVADEDAAEIRRQVEEQLGRPCRCVCQPPIITRKLLQRASAIAGPDGIPYQVDVTEDEDDQDEEDEDQ